MGKRKGRGRGGPNHPPKRVLRSSAARTELDPVPSTSKNLQLPLPSPPPPRRSHRQRKSAPTMIPSPRAVARPSRKGISRAEEIQRQADAIPSIKTSDWNPYTVFPKEIWVHIFDYLSDPKDMESVMNATMEWNELYLNKRTSLLFSSVLNIMAEKGPLDVASGMLTSTSTTNTEKYLERNDYINCRLVCQTWSHSVENYLQLHPFHFELDPLRDEEDLMGFASLIRFPHQSWQQTDQFAWVFPETLEEETAEMAQSHPPARNPFLTRRITLGDVNMACPCCNRAGRSLQISQRWWASVAALLERYGSHVWHCRINFSRHMTLFGWYTHIQHWISLMPNLKTLNLVFAIPTEVVRRRELRQLEDQIAICPFPDLEKLVSLKIVNLPSIVFNELVSKTSNLHKLQVRLTGNKAVRLSHYNLNLIPNDLSEAYLTMAAAEDFTHLQSATISWPLKTLYFHLAYENRDLGTFRRWPDWGRTFKMLEEKFGPTLTELKLRLPMATKDVDKKKILDECLLYRLNLPNVKKLRVVVPNLMSFDFLLPLKDSLEELSIVVDHCESGNKGANALKRKEILKINGNFSRLFKSNVWETFPKLKLVDLFIQREPTAPRDKDYCFYSYIRHTYDKESGVHTDHEAFRNCETHSRRRTRQDSVNENMCLIV